MSVTSTSGSSICSTVDLDSPDVSGTFMEVGISSAPTGTAWINSDDSWILYDYFNQFRRRLEQMEQGDEDANAWQRISAHFEHLPAKTNDTSLATCDSGSWILQPVDGSYPYYYAGDCASHPADIESQWESYACALCVGQPVSDIVIECAASDLSTISSSTTSKDPSSSSLPAPAPSSPIEPNSPAVQIMDGQTLAPGNTYSIDDDEDASCETVTVLDAMVDGDYTSTGDAVDGRYSYEHESGALLAWYENSLSRRGLRADNKATGVARPGDASGSRFSFTPPTEAIEAAVNAEMSKATCLEGAWVLSNAVSFYPILLTLNCALHPADAEGQWYFQYEEEGGIEAHVGPVEVSCPGDDGSSSHFFMTSSASANSGISARADGTAGGVDGDNGLGTGAIVGIVAGGGAAVLLVALCILGVCCMRKRKHEHQQAPVTSGDNDQESGS